MADLKHGLTLDGSGSLVRQEIVTTLERCWTHPEGRDRMLMAVPHYRPSERILVRDLVSIVGVDAVLWILETIETHHRDVAVQLIVKWTRRLLPIWSYCYRKDERPHKAWVAANDHRMPELYAARVAMEADQAALMANEQGMYQQSMVALLTRFICDEVHENRQSTPVMVMVGMIHRVIGDRRFRKWRHRRWSERTLRKLLI